MLRHRFTPAVLGTACLRASTIGGGVMRHRFTPAVLGAERLRSLMIGGV